jgi:CheY-like chemotaxis protein
LFDIEQRHFTVNGKLTPDRRKKRLAESDMPNRETRLLIVDDEPSIRMSLSSVLAEIGYSGRTAEDGMSALTELRREVPEILISDLNMPGMSGFELLSMVRLRFPTMKTIAMSGMFNGSEVPSGLAADGFYQKGSSVGCLLRLMDGLPQSVRRAHSDLNAAELGWVKSAERPAAQDFHRSRNGSKLQAANAHQNSN